MKYRTVFISIIFLLTLLGCGKEPIADFSWEPKQPKVGQEVKFSNLSTNAKSYSWNFGDMSIGKESDPIHIYLKKGSYIVDLNAQNGLQSNEKTVTINVVD